MPSDILKKRAAVRTAETLTKRKGVREGGWFAAQTQMLFESTWEFAVMDDMERLIASLPESPVTMGTLYRGGKGPSDLRLTSKELWM